MLLSLSDSSLACRSHENSDPSLLLFSVFWHESHEKSSVNKHSIEWDWVRNYLKRLTEEERFQRGQDSLLTAEAQEHPKQNPQVGHPVLHSTDNELSHWAGRGWVAGMWEGVQAGVVATWALEHQPEAVEWVLTSLGRAPLLFPLARVSSLNSFFPKTGGRTRGWSSGHLGPFILYATHYMNVHFSGGKASMASNRF